MRLWIAFEIDTGVREICWVNSAPDLFHFLSSLQFVLSLSLSLLPADCRKTRLGLEYRGVINFGRTGKICQPWEDQWPHMHNQNANKYRPLTMADLSNYCRNPDGYSEGPWCYTMDDAVRWEHCDPPSCIGERSIPLWWDIAPQNVYCHCKSSPQKDLQNEFGIKWNAVRTHVSVVVKEATT